VQDYDGVALYESMKSRGSWRDRVKLKGVCRRRAQRWRTGTGIPPPVSCPHQTCALPSLSLSVPVRWRVQRGKAGESRTLRYEVYNYPRGHYQDALKDLYTVEGANDWRHIKRQWHRAGPK
jgi:hypothetical protein